MSKRRLLSVPDLIAVYVSFDDARKCLALWRKESERISTTQGSSHNHQAWAGGYEEHIKQVLNIAIDYYESLNNFRPLTFSLSDALVVLFIHDLEKPWKKDHSETFKDKKNRALFRVDKAAAYDITLTEEQQNALKYVEGEGDDYRSDRRVMNEMAAFCHICDVTSARIWHDWRSQ